MNINDIDFIALGGKLNKLKKKNRIRSYILKVIGKFIGKTGIPYAVIEILIDLEFIKQSEVSVSDGYVYSPFIPLMTSDNISIPMTVPARTGVLSRYAKQKIGGYYNTVSVGSGSAKLGDYFIEH